MSADLIRRYVWLPFAAPNSSAGASGFTGLALRNGRVALSMTLDTQANSNRRLITYQALQAEYAGGKEGYLVVWKP